jgi:23S rRNA (cytidine1920-2'-O)/16S rRNA (cytidine1409-2'-O)-methyltransferase
VDVGYGQLDWKMRQDPRVVAMERTNARFLESLPEPVSLVTIDASFISLHLLLPAARRIGRPDVEVVALIKPQFEAGRERVGKGGVVRDSSVHREVLQKFVARVSADGWGLRGLTSSPLRGPAGNVEFLAHLCPGETVAPLSSIDDALAEAQSLSAANP